MSCDFINNTNKKIIKVACLGDSITRGASIKKPKKNSYPANLAKMLGKDYEVRNFGVDGSTALEGNEYSYNQSKEFKDLLLYQPDLVIIKLGTNDAKDYLWKSDSDFIQSMRNIIDQLNQLHSNPIIYLCYPAKVYGKNYFEVNDNIVKNNIIPAIDSLAKEYNLTTIDLYSVTDNMPENFRDKIHPNEVGYKTIATKIYNTIKTKL